jgi:hypothetical protein
MITIVRARRTFPSTLFGALEDSDVTRSIKIVNFFNGRDLNIIVDSMGTDGSVNYAAVRVYLEVETCNTDAECSMGANNCVTATCNASNKCDYQTVAGCCGNGICEKQFGENCATCTNDCKKPDDCNDLGYFDLPQKCTKVGDFDFFIFVQTHFVIKLTHRFVIGHKDRWDVVSSWSYV